MIKPGEIQKKATAAGVRDPYFQKDAIILDFFSGSATTAHAVMQLNAEDEGNRKFILVQLPEPCDEKSETFKVGYKNICEIGKEQIRRAGKKINVPEIFKTLSLDTTIKVI
jgi:adenine-specific DNA-methyltransferase